MTPIAIRLNFDMNFGDLCPTPHGEMVVKRQILVMGAIKRDTAWPEKRGKRVNTLKPLLWPDNDMANTYKPLIRPHMLLAQKVFT